MNTLFFWKFVLGTAILRVPSINFIVTQIRYIFFKIFFNPYQQSPNSNINRYAYSANAFSKFLIHPLTRSSLPYQLLSIIFWPETFNKKILIIGPRYESDIFFARGYGFQKMNISAIDLFSYTPLIQVGDGHDLAKLSDNFDAVVLPWVLIYSNSQEQIITQSWKCLKKNGFLIISGDNCQTGPESGNESYLFDENHLREITKTKFNTLFNYSYSHDTMSTIFPVFFLGRKIG